MKDPLTCLDKLPEILNVYKNGLKEAERAAKDTVPDAPATPPTLMAAVDNCCRAYRLAWQSAKERGVGRNVVKAEADLAYRTAMPPLFGCENIQDFIACVAHGVLLDAISGPNAARLLYAAQVANSAAKAFGDSFKCPPGFFLQRLDTPNAPLPPEIRKYYASNGAHSNSLPRP